MTESSPQNCSTVAVAVNTLLVSLTLRFIAARQLTHTLTLARLAMYIRKTHLMVGTSDLSWLLSHTNSVILTTLHSIPLLSPSEW